MILFDPGTATDLVDALRLLDGRVRGTGRRLAKGTIDVQGWAEVSLRVWNGNGLAGGGVVVDDAGVLDLLTFRETAERLRLSEETVKRLVRDGRLSAVSVGRARRVRPADLAAFIESLGADVAKWSQQAMEAKDGGR